MMLPTTARRDRDLIRIHQVAAEPARKKPAHLSVGHYLILATCRGQKLNPGLKEC